MSRFRPALAAAVTAVALLAIVLPASANAARVTAKAALAIKVTAAPDSETKSRSATFAYYATAGKRKVTGVTFSCSLDGSKAIACSSPDAYTGLRDGKHVMVISATKVLSKKKKLAGSVTVRWVVDTARPTVPTLGGTTTAWSATPVTITASGSTDGGKNASGFDRFESEVSADGGRTWRTTAIGAARTIASEGSTFVRFRAFDDAGNFSAYVFTEVRIDTTAPSIPVLAGGSNAWQQVGAIVIFGSGSADQGVGSVSYQYRTSGDGVNWGAAVTAGAASIAAEGTTYVQFRAVDGLGNASAWTPTPGTAEGTARIDRTSPSNPNVSGGSNTWTRFPVTIAGSGSTDALSGVAYETRTSANGGATFGAAFAGSTATVTADGETIVQVRAVDAAGNVSEWAPSSAGAGSTAKIDVTNPVMPVTVTGSSTTWFSNVASRTVTATGGSDSVSPFIYEHRTSYDGAAFSAAVAGDTLEVTADGETLVQFRTKDSSNNVSAWTASAIVRLDHVAPTAPTVAGGASNFQNVASDTVTATASTDLYATPPAYEYRTSSDGVTFGTATPGNSVTVTAEGTQYVQFRTTDLAGNSSAWTPAANDASNTIKIDRTNPVMPATLTGGSNAWIQFASKTVTAADGSDAVSPFVYEYRTSHDGASFPTTGTVGNSVSVTLEGETLVQFRTKDSAGNVSAWTASEIVRLDRTPATVPTVTGGNGVFQNAASKTVTASASSDDYTPNPSYEYRTSSDGTTFGAAVAGSSIVVSDEGSTYVQFRSKDLASNYSEWEPVANGASNTVKLDRTLPTAPTVAGGSLTWLKQASKTVSASGSTDAISAATYEYRTSTDAGTTWSSEAAGNSVVVTADGETLVQFRSIDTAGNFSAWTPAVADATNTVRLDNSAPSALTVTGGSTAFQDVASVTITGSGSSDALSNPVSYEYRTSTDGITFGAAVAGNSVVISDEGTTYVQVRATDSANNVGAWTPAVNNAGNTVKIDRTAPTAPTLAGGSATWKNATVTISASGSTDVSGSGVDHYVYETSTDNVSWSGATSAAFVAFASEGTHYARFRAVDVVGRVSANSTVDALAIAKLDLTLPTAPVVSGGSPSYANSPSRSIIAGGSTDAGGSTLAGYQFHESINDGAFSAPVSGATDLVVREGKTVVEFRSIDVAGNVSAWTPVTPGANNMVLLDRSVPSDPLVTGGSASYQHGPVTIIGSGSSDLYNNSGLAYEYRLSTDGGATYGASFPGASVAISASGITNVQFHAIDGIGNTTAWFPSTPDAQSTVKIDLVAPPVPTVTGGSDAWLNQANTTFSATSTDLLSNPVTYMVRTSTDGTTWGTPVAAAGGTATVSAEGVRYVQFQAIDASGNASAFGPDPVEAASTSKLDRTIPLVPTVAGGDNQWHDAASIAVTASGGSDVVSSILRLEYRTKVNAAEFSTETTGASVSPNDEGTTLVEYRSVDQAGNVSAWVGGIDGTVKLDRTDPNVPTVTGLGSTWHATKPVVIEADGTDELSGVAKYQYSTDGGTSWTDSISGSVGFSDEGVSNVEFRTIDNAGNKSASSGADTLNIDTIAPDAPTTIDGSTVFQKASRTLTASGGDGTGSALSYMYETSDDDGLTWSDPSAGDSKTFASDGRHRIRFYSVDEAGNTSDLSTGALADDNAAYIDNAAPTGMVVTGGSSAYSNTAQVTSATDAVDALEGHVNYYYQFSVDGGGYGSDVAGNSFTATTDGDYLVRFRVEDGLGNSTPFSTPVELHIDTTAPTAPTSLTGGSLTWDNTRTTATFVASGSTDVNGGDAAVTYEYLLTTNSGAPTTASPTVTAQGETTAQVRAKDRAGNYSAYFAGAAPGNTIRIDTVAPTLPSVSGGSMTWQKTTPRSITASGSTDTTASVVTSGVAKYVSETQLNGGSFGGATDGATVAVAQDGTTVVKFKAVDLAGNESAFTSAVSSADNTARIDTTAPTAPTVKGGSAAWVGGSTVSQTIQVDAAGTDEANGSGVDHYQYKLDGDDDLTAVTGSSATFSTTGEHTVQFRTVDAAGNVSAWAPATPTALSTSRLDVTAPSVPVASGGSSTFQNAASVTVDATGTSTDPNSGGIVYTYQTSTNGGAWLPLAPAVGSSVAVTDEGTTLVRFYATDAAGNTSMPSAVTSGATVKLDRTAPSNPSAAGGSAAWQKVASVDVSPAGSTDGVGSGIASYEYRTSTDNGVTFSAAAPVVGGKVTISAEADTVVQFRAADVVGFTSAWSPSPPIPASTVRLDRTSPTAPSITGGSSAFQDAASVVVTASGSDGGLSAGVTYVYRTRLNTGSWVEGSGASVTVSNEGTTDVEFKSIDGAGNESAWTSAAGSSTVKLDRTAPTVPVVTGGYGATWKPATSSPVTFSASSTDTNGVAGITYESRITLNGVLGSAVAGPSVDVSTEGVSVVEFRAKDALNHWSAWSSSVAAPNNSVSLDKTDPTVPTLGGGSTFWRDDASVSVSLATSTDAGGSGLAGRQYRTTTNGGTASGWTAYVTPFSVSVEGDTLIEARSLDNAGNASAIDSTHVKLDRLSPTDSTVTGGNGSAAPCGTTSLTITGSGSSDGVGSGIAFYEYRTSTNGGSTWSGATTGTSVTLSNATTTPVTTLVQFRATDLGGHASAWAPFNAGTGNTAKLCDVVPAALVVADDGINLVRSGPTTDTISVKLSRQPSASVTVVVWITNGPGDITSSGPLTFTTANWDSYQTLTLTIPSTWPCGGGGGGGTPTVNLAAADGGFDGVGAAQPFTWSNGSATCQF